MLRAPEVGARSAPALRALASPCPSRYRLEFVAPWLSRREVRCRAPVHRFLVQSYHLFIGSTIGGATRPPSRPTSAFCPCSGLVAWLCANKGAPPRLPFRSRPLASRLLGVAPPAIAESGLGLATLAPLFCRLPLCFAVCGLGGFPPRVPCGVCPPCPRPDCPLAVVLFCRLPPCATRPLFCVVARCAPMLIPHSLARGAVCPPPPPPECFSWLGRARAR